MIRRRLSLLVLLLAFVGVGAWRGPALFWWATTEVYWTREDGAPGVVFEHAYWRWYSGSRFDGLWWVSWEQETGMRRAEEVRGKRTWWFPTGEIEEQTRYDDPEFFLDQPPWRWGKTDLVSPDAPWVLADMTLDDWWDSLPDEVKEEW